MHTLRRLLRKRRSPQDQQGSRQATRQRADATTTARKTRAPAAPGCAYGCRQVAGWRWEVPYAAGRCRVRTRLTVDGLERSHRGGGESGIRTHGRLAPTAVLLGAPAPRPLGHRPAQPMFTSASCLADQDCLNSRLAEGVGFEPTDGYPSLVFKTSAIDHSATLPLCVNSSGSLLLRPCSGGGRRGRLWNRRRFGSSP